VLIYEDRQIFNLAFKKRNEQTTQNFTDYYRNLDYDFTLKILKSNIFHHYPFKLDFLKENQEYIDFDWIIWNESLDWSIEEFEFVRDKVKFPLKTILRNSKITLNDKILLKYFDELSPGSFDYHSGITIKWDENALSTFSEKIDIVRLSPMLEVSTDYLEKEKGKIDWESLSYNGYIQWTEEFIERNKGLLNWEELSHNSSLPWSEELIDKFEKYWNWDSLSQNQKINWTEELINKYDKKLNWDVLSYNSNANLSIQLVEKNIDKIDFSGLSRNNKIEWSKELISKYEDKLNFGNYGLSWNFNLPWDKDFINQYKDKWSW